MKYIYILYIRMILILFELNICFMCPLEIVSMIEFACHKTHCSSLIVSTKEMKLH